MACRSCSAAIEPFIDFGRMPLANAFVRPNELGNERFYNLAAGWCARCTLVQLIEQPSREDMFNARYPFFTGSSIRMSAHFGRLATEVINKWLPAGDPFVIEIGSNDGTLLQHAEAAGVRHLGVEPSASVAAASTARGVTTLCAFFDLDIARKIRDDHGSADVVIATNAMSHVGDLHGILAAIDHVLASNGVVIIEDPYWGDVLKQTAFDQIYDEHASYFTLSSLQQLIESHALTVFDVGHFDVHGGSMRYFIARSGARQPSPRVAELASLERRLQLGDYAPQASFAQRVTTRRDDLIALLEVHRSAGRRVVGYGATSKATTTINFCGITSDLVEFICDTTPAKHGTVSPGAHIPVRPHHDFAANHPERALLFLWNHAAEVLAKEQDFIRGGGRFITYVPDVAEL